MILKTSEEWSKDSWVIIRDPDGWDRINFQYSWYEEKISKKEFEKRLTFSTCSFKKPLINKNGEVNSIWNE